MFIVIDMFLFNHLCMYVLQVFLDLLVCTSCVHDMLCIYLFLCVNLFAYTFAYWEAWYMCESFSNIHKMYSVFMPKGILACIKLVHLESVGNATYWSFLSTLTIQDTVWVTLWPREREREWWTDDDNSFPRKSHAKIFHCESPAVHKLGWYEFVVICFASRFRNYYPPGN